MSTEIRCVEPLCNRETPNDFTLDVREPHITLDEVFIRMNGDRSLPGHYVSRADFLAAVETECGVRMVATDAIVTERELPGVVRHPGRGDLHAGSASVGPGTTASTARWSALSYLALAEYLAAHPPMPPVSDEDVETLAGLLESAKLNDSAEGTYRPAARRLLATGRVSVTRE